EEDDKEADKEAENKDNEENEETYRIWRSCILEQKLILWPGSKQPEDESIIKQIEGALRTEKNVLVVRSREQFLASLDRLLLPHYCWATLPSWATSSGRVFALQIEQNAE